MDSRYISRDDYMIRYIQTEIVFIDVLKFKEWNVTLTFSN